ALVIFRLVTGRSAATLPPPALSSGGDYYPYQQRGRAMGVLSMGYSAAIVVGVPAGALTAWRFGWRWVFASLSTAAVLMLALTVLRLPRETRHTQPRPHRRMFSDHFRKRDRLAGVAAAFLTSRGVLGFLTYFCGVVKPRYVLG